MAYNAYGDGATIIIIIIIIRENPLKLPFFD